MSLPDRVCAGQGDGVPGRGRVTARRPRRRTRETDEPPTGTPASHGDDDGDRLTLVTGRPIGSSQLVGDRLMDEAKVPTDGRQDHHPGWSWSGRLVRGVASPSVDVSCACEGHRRRTRSSTRKRTPGDPAPIQAPARQQPALDASAANARRRVLGVEAVERQEADK